MGKWKCLAQGMDGILTAMDFCCALFEMHMVKIVAVTIMALCCSMANAFHIVIVIILLICLPFGCAALRFSFIFIGPVIGLLFLSQMAYQTNFFPKVEEDLNCTSFNLSIHKIVENTILDPGWWGLVVLPNEDILISRHKNYVLVFVVMTMQAVITARQKIIRIDEGESPKTPQVMYLKITRKSADKNLSCCLKYLINYGFYKFGVEITLTFCVFVITYRMDVFSVLYAIWVLILFSLRRSTTALFWPFFLITVSVSILWQYTMAVGLSKNTCFNYPWNDDDPIVLWMFLPNFKGKLNTKKTLADFILAMFIQRQQAVFEIERKYGEQHYGGSNREEYSFFNDADFVNPTPDHTGSIKSWLDVFKFLFMTCLFRVTLAFLFWNGANNVNFLSLGYLVGAFVFLWIDYDLCLWRIKKILKWWNTLLGYIVLLVLAKAILEFAGCIYGDYLRKNWHWSVEILSIKCRGLKSDDALSSAKRSFYWDAVCFALVIFQKRYFKSFYFQHEMDDALGVLMLQAKGARLVDELQEKKLMEFYRRENKTLMKIKQNMNRIKAWQKRMQGLKYSEPTDHASATYMGDYYMFEDLDEAQMKLEESSSSSDDFDETGKKKPKSLTMTEFIGTVFKRGDEMPARPERKTQPQTPPPKGGGKVEQKKKDAKEEKDKKDKKRAEPPEPSKSLPASKESKTGIERDKKKLCETFIKSVMVSLIRFFNRHSKDYIYIQSMMKTERIKYKFRIRSSRDYSDRIERGKTPVDDSKNLSSRLSTKSNEFRDEDEQPKSQTLLVNLINSICMFVMSKTELLSYMIIFLHTVLSPTLISLPLPLLVFLWGSLTSVRPTTTFWTVLIAYTEVTVVIKAVFQHAIFPWNNVEKKQSLRPEYPPVFLGIHRDNQYVIADLFLLLLLFLHRYKLKTLGLWNRTHEEESAPPQNLNVYKLLSLEAKDIKGRSSTHQKKKPQNEPLGTIESEEGSNQMSRWKCTSRATAKLIHVGNKVKAVTRITEIEGRVLVTHEGRRLQPTGMHISQMTDEELEKNVVLRVIANDVVIETRTVFYRLSWIQHFTSLRKFFIQILDHDRGMSSDFYTLMFIFEFLNFLIVFFGYSSFTDPIDIQSDDYFSLVKSQVPAMYLLTTIAHFVVIIIDRIFYLKKLVICKLITQMILVTMVHTWMFIVIPILTESSFHRLHVPQIYYIISCFYFLMSAYQLREGYPLRVQGHFLCKKYGYVNYYCYKGLQLIPFFNQFRVLLDYLCVRTSLSLMEWVRMESIFQLVFENKCCRRADIYYPSARGREYPKGSKYPISITVFLVLVIIIWLPFLIFALFNTVAQPNLPQEANIEAHIGNFGKIYTTMAKLMDIIPYSEGQYKTLQSIYKNNKKIWTFLAMYDHRDVGVLKFRSEPYTPWSISPQELKLLNKTIQSADTPITVYFTWEVKRAPRSQIVEVAYGKCVVVLEKNTKARQQLIDVFMGKDTSILLNNVLPKFMHITNEGAADPVIGFLKSYNRTTAYRNVTMSLVKDQSALWWKLKELSDDPAEDQINRIPLESHKEITIFTFNEKNIPLMFYNISKKGIIGLYLSIVFVLWAFVKRVMWKYPYIMFEDMPNPDFVLKLCHDIYLARENQEFALEEDLYAKLLFLFRSPETMIKVTRLNY